MKRQGWFVRLLGRIGRRYWLPRIDRALGRAYEQGLIGSWLLHEMDHRMKYGDDPARCYVRPAAAEVPREG